MGGETVTQRFHPESLLRPWPGSARAASPGEELCAALIDKFLDRVEVVDAEALGAVARRPCLYLANHQTSLETLLFVAVLPRLTAGRVVALSREIHRQPWLDQLVSLIFGTPGAPMVDPFDDDTAEIGELIDRLESLAAGGSSLLVHVEGGRQRSARRGTVVAVSPLWIGVAIADDWPIVPVRFVGGLPVDDLGVEHDAPFEYGKQIIRVGRPILPDELMAVPAGQRVEHVRAAIDALQDPLTEEPGDPDPGFARAVERWVERTGCEPMPAAILMALERLVRRRNLEITLDGSPDAPLDPCDALVAVAETARERPASLSVPAGEEGAWLARAARLFFGPRGPAIVEAQPAARRVAGGSADAR